MRSCEKTVSGWKFTENILDELKSIKKKRNKRTGRRESIREKNEIWPGCTYTSFKIYIRQMIRFR